ncbi:hypothetical protein AB0F45_36815, partial [Streptomyces achromogenes]|uniref:hypothetical protein n=1 Tax=Streptomyces achromogenes TaxID=67255 RepID=UPI0033F76470
MVDVLDRAWPRAEQVHGAPGRVLRQQPAPLPIPAQLDDQDLCGRDLGPGEPGEMFGWEFRPG